MPNWFPTEVGRTQYGYNISLRGQVALNIIRHNSLLTAQINGEDSAGRSKMDNMSAKVTAERALDIADALVSGFEARGWITPLTMTPEEDWAASGRLSRIKANQEFSHV